MSHKRVVALDLGEKRIGVAVADSNKILAMPWAIVERRSDYKATYRAIADALEGLEIDFIVVGLPISLSGEFNQAAEHIRDEADKLLAFFGVKLVLWDERNSSKEAFSLLKMARAVPDGAPMGSIPQNATEKLPADNLREDYPGAKRATIGLRKNSPTFHKRLSVETRGSSYKGANKQQTRHEKTRIDDKAAALILQSYLDSLN